MNEMKGHEPYGNFYRCSIGPNCREQSMVPISFVLVNYPLKQGFDNFVDSLNMTIFFQILRGGKLTINPNNKDK